MNFVRELDGGRDTNLAVSLIHLLGLPALLGLFATGMQIAASNRLDDIAHLFRAVLPTGEMHFWHSLFGAVLLAVFVLYLSTQLLIGKFERIRFLKAQTSSKVLSSFNGFTWLGLLSLFVAAASGLILFLFNAWPSFVHPLHQLSAWASMLFWLLHGFMALLVHHRTAILGVFIPSRPSLGALALTALVLVGVPFSLYGLVSPSQNQLVIKRTNQTIELDGEGRERAWGKMAPVTVQTFNGHPSERNIVNVEVKALHDGVYGYFLLQWPDTTKSLSHLPLIKTEEGWKVLQRNALTADENHFYEDKFAVMLSRSSQLAGAGTVHLGQKPHSAHPNSAGGRGLHYTTDGSITDVWHWKAVRTGGFGQADDNFFGTAIPSKSEYKRYTSGYQKDLDCEHKVRFEGNDFHLKPECGGYLMNWKLYSDDIVQPLRLPKDQTVLARMGKPNLDAKQSDRGRWWLAWNDTVRYSPDIDSFTVGTVIPSVLSLGRFTQGRGDVDAVGSWTNGKWTLEIRRKLTLNNKDDLPIEDGMHLWVAAFDHSQTRHTYHMRPLTLKLEN